MLKLKGKGDKNPDKVYVFDDLLSGKKINKLNNKGYPVFINDLNSFLSKGDLGIDRCIVSPGIARDHRLIMELSRRRIPVYSEIEFAYESLASLRKDVKILAITGTNGKTTTASLCGAVMKNTGENVFVGGNIGVPFITGVNDYSKFILEISSFQLEWTYRFNPDIAVLLNVQDDHLDRYDNFDEYRLTKYKLFKNQNYNDIAILNYDDYNARILKGVISSNTILFGFDEKKCNVYYKEDIIYLKLKDIAGFDIKISLNNVKDKRKFIISDMMAAAAAMGISGILPEIIKKTFDEYRLLKHRVEFLGRIGNVDFYDDSKATNPSAVISALESFSGSDKVILILGGKDKGFNYECLKEPVKRHVRACVLMGETAEMLYQTLKNMTTIIKVKDMQEAVVQSFELSGGSGTVILSPASSSFDMFKDYSERGEVFKKCVENLSRTVNIR